MTQTPMASIGDRAAAILEGVEKQGIDFFSKNGRGANVVEDTERIQSDYIHSVMRDASATDKFGAIPEKFTVTLKVEGSLKDLYQNPEKRKVVAIVPPEYLKRSEISCSNVLGARIVAQNSQFPFEIGFNFGGSIPVNSQYIGTSEKAFDYVLDTTNGEVSTNIDLFSMSDVEKSNVIRSPFHYLSVMSEVDIRDCIVKADEDDIIVLKSDNIVSGIAATIVKNSSSGETFKQGPTYCVVSKELGNQAIRQAYQSVERAKKEVFDFSNINTEIDRIDGSQFDDIQQICDGNGYVPLEQVADQYRKAYIRVELDVCTKYVNQ